MHWINRKTLLLFVLILFVFGEVRNKYFISNRAIIGKYCNVNYEGEVLTEMPAVQDTLILSPKGYFKSLFWGSGNYELHRSVKGMEIILNYSYEFGRAETSLAISKSWFSEPQIIVNDNRNHFYRKCDSTY